MKKKRNGLIVTLLVVMGLMLALAPDILCTDKVLSGKNQTVVYASAADYPAKGNYGENLTHALSSAGTLSITGAEDIDSFLNPASVSWPQYRSVLSLTPDISCTDTVLSGKDQTAVYAGSADYLTRGTCGENLTYTLSSDGILSITGEGDMDSFSDPASVPWSQYRSEITEVIFNGKITSIGTYAFEYCVNLKNISIPDSVIKIGAHAFYWCSSLTEIKIPDNVTEIGDYAFYDCSKLTSITLPDGLKKIGSYAFCGCTSLTDIVVPESVTSIGEGAFENSGIDDSEIAYKRGSCGTDLTWALLGGQRLYVYGTGSMTDYSSASSVPWHGNCEDITDVVITDGVTGIGAYAFEGCSSLNSVTLAKSVTDIGKNAFAKCIGLKEIEIRENITKISDYAFYQSGLTKVSISSNETVSVGDYVFAGCTALSDVSLTGGKIGAYMFSDCTALEQIDIPKEVTELGSYAFQNCKGISSIVLDSVTAIQEGVFSGCSGLEKIQFSPNIETIGNNAFKNCVGFDSFVIPDSVTSIGNGAFSGCSHLERITLPFVGGSAEETQASAKTLFGYVFGTVKYDGGTAVKQYYSASGNVTCYLPDLLLDVEITGGEILYGAFDGCASLEHITLPDKVAKIDSYVFRGCKGLENITVADSVADIGAYAFSGCTGLSSIKLPKNLQSIGSGAFKDCTGLEGIELPENITGIESDTFNGCTKLQGIRISEKISSIGDYAFSGCIGIENIKLPETVTDIGKGVFKDCTGLQGIVIPKGITDIPEYLFYGCTALKDITISGNVAGIGNYAFSGCEVLEEIVIPETVTNIGSYAFSGCSLMKNIRIPKETVGIGSGAFKDCIGLEKIEVPDSVADIGSSAFSGCSSLNSITLPFIGGSAEAVSPAAGTLFGYIFGTAGYTGGTAVRQYYSSSGSSTYYIPDALTSVKVTGGKILYGSFYGCGRLEEISLAGDLPEIGASAFYNCAALKRISIPETVTAVADKAFYGCVGLGNITLPDHVESIGSYVFSGCTGLDSISLSENLTTIGSYAFQNCSSIRRIQVPDSVTSINTAAFSGCSSLESIILPFAGSKDGQTSASASSLFGYIFGTSKYEGGVATKQNYSSNGTTYYIPASLKTVSITGGAVLYGTFYNCSNLTEITLPEQLTGIGNYAFYNCTDLTQITLPEQLTEIGNYAFSNCTNLTKITLPERLTKIGDHIFDNCAGLEEAVLSDGVEYIGSYAFKGCTGLKKFSIPEGVTSIESYTFSGCTGLKSITIPESVTSIGGYAFQNCSSMTGITVPDAVTAINTAAFSGCSSLESMTLPFVGAKSGQTSASSSALFGAIFGTTSYTGGIQTKQYYSSSSLATYYIPETLKKVVITGGSVLYGAFYNCHGLTDITLPENLAELGNYAFCNCSGLRNITLPENVTKIGSNTFQDCSGMTGITLPKQLTGIGTSAFQNCSSLAVIMIPSSVTSIGQGAFKDCTGLQEFSVPKTVVNIEKNTFSGCIGLKNIIIPDGITTIGGNAFQNCSSLTNIMLPNSVTTIDSAAFSGCSSLKSMTLPFVGGSRQTSASSKTLFGYIFGTTSYEGGTLTQQYYSGSSVKNYIPASLKTVAVTGGSVLYGAFYNCSGLTDVILPDDLTSIGQSAFYNCSSLTGIVIPSGVTTISKNAFAKCTGIKSITFSGSAPKTIDKTAFTDVTATVYYPISDDTWSAHIGNDYGGTLDWKAHTHSYQAVVIKPTCTEQGYTEYRCSACNSRYKSDFVNALGHESVIDAGIQPTCTRTGLTEGAHCSVCKEVIYKQEIIPALGHRYTDYVSNQDASYDADGTMTAECDNGCGAKETITDKGSMLTDSSKPEIEISLGNNRWTGIPDQITFDLLFKEAQTVTVTAKDEETLLDGKKVNRLDKVYYYIADSEIKQTQLESVSWTEYTGAINLKPDKQYIVYAKAVDRSRNTAYASSQGIIVDDAAPTFDGISDGSVYCEKAVFTVTDVSLKSVTDNGVVIMPVDGRYTIEGDDRKHTIVATDGLGHVASVTITLNRGHKWGSYSYNNDAACETAGTKTAVCEYGCGVEDTQVDEAHPALGHNFGEPVFLWSDDYESCIASYVCTRDNSHVETVNCTVKAESTGNSCTEATETIYTATAIHDGIENTDSKTVLGDALGHDYRAEFIWSADKSSCVVTLTCQRETCSDDADGHILRGLVCKVETKTVEATCILEGKKEVVASIIVDGVEYTESGSVEVLPVDGTNHVNTKVTGAKSATVTENGYTGDTYCEDCNKILAYGSVIPALGDTDVPGDANIPGNTEISDKKPTGTPDGKDENRLPNDAIMVPAKGSKIKSSNGETYTVTKAGSTGGKVSYTAPKNKKIKSAKIPADVKIDGITYKVTMIADSAFANCKKLTKVTMGSNITTIGKNAFKNCSKLKKVTIPYKVTNIGSKAFYGCKELANITVKSKKLKTVGKKAFKGIKTTAKVKVPAEKLKDYKKLLKKAGLSSKAKITK